MFDWNTIQNRFYIPSFQNQLWTNGLSHNFMNHRTSGNSPFVSSRDTPTFTSQMIELGHFRAEKLTFSSGITRNAPPPAASVIMATYLGFTLQNVESQEDFVILILSYPWSLFNACPKTCRNLLCLTTRNDIWKINVKEVDSNPNSYAKMTIHQQKVYCQCSYFGCCWSWGLFHVKTGEIPHWIIKSRHK